MAQSISAKTIAASSILCTQLAEGNEHPQQSACPSNHFQTTEDGAYLQVIDDDTDRLQPSNFLTNLQKTGENKSDRLQYANDGGNSNESCAINIGVSYKMENETIFNSKKRIL